MSPKILVGGTALALVAIFVIGVAIFKQQKVDEAERSAVANQANLVRQHSPSLGQPDARVVIVEFLDPACETCRAFYPRVKQLLAANPDKIRLVLRYAPFHPGSDKVVALLEAARRQDRFWPALEALLATQAEWAPHHTAQVTLAWKHLEGLGLNMEQLAYDVTAAEIAQVIARDLADAQTLGMTRTPEFFVNGKPLPSFGYEQLKAMVEAALAAAPVR